MAVGLSGNLVDFGIADVFQLIGQQRKTGVLELRNRTKRAQLVFDRGLVVSAAPAGGRSNDTNPLADRLVRCGHMTRERAAEATAACRASAQTLPQVVVELGWLDEETVARVEDLLTKDTLFDVLRWQTGTFDFRAEDVHHERDPASLLGAEQILMDGLRMIDEWQSFADLVPSEATVFHQVGTFETYARTTRRNSEEELDAARHVFERVDARLSARRVIDLAQLGTFDGMRYLAELCQAGAIRPLNAEGTRRANRAAAASGLRAAAFVRGLVAVLPLALLAGMVWWIRVAVPAAPPAEGYAIERAGLEALREAYAARGVRNAIEARRLEEGRWPESVEALMRSPRFAGDRLAAPDGRPYYSRRLEGGLVFLAPER